MSSKDSSLILTVGFDEAGRGPLAGPVCAGAVILPPDFPLEILNDSKKLSEKKREFAEQIIKEKAFWGIGLVDHKKIDEINILQASLLAMKLAYEDLESRFLNENLRSLSLSKGRQLPSHLRIPVHYQSNQHKQHSEFYLRHSSQYKSPGNRYRL